MHGGPDSGFLYKCGGGLKIKKKFLAAFLCDGVRTLLRTKILGVPRPISGGGRKNALSTAVQGVCNHFVPRSEDLPLSESYAGPTWA